MAFSWGYSPYGNINVSTGTTCTESQSSRAARMRQTEEASAKDNSGWKLHPSAVALLEKGIWDEVNTNVQKDEPECTRDTKGIAAHYYNKYLNRVK